MKGKTVVITGSESGIGMAAARLFLEQGAAVVGLDILDHCSFTGESQYTLHQVDAADLAALGKVLAELESGNQQIDVLVNSAGVTSLTPVPDVTPAEWDMVMNINLRSTFFCCQHVLRGMVRRRQGKIINISSNAGKSGGEIVGPHYCISKAGVISLTITLAQYAAKFNVQVNCVAPGPTETSMTSVWTPETKKALEGRIPMKRLAKPEEVAQAIFFLAGNRADYITGEILDVNGGLLMD